MTGIISKLMLVVVLGLGVIAPRLAGAQELGHDLALPMDRTPLSQALPLLHASLQMSGADGSARERKVVDKRFAGLGAALFGTMTLDTYSTFKSNAWCPSCREGNPYAAPFVNRGPAVTYSAGLLFDTGVLGMSAAMRRSANPAIRKIWWAPAVALIVGHGVAIQNNFSLRHRCQREPGCRP